MGKKIGCGNCINSYVCGGCRARARGCFSGNLNAPDIGCINKEELWIEMTRPLAIA